MTTKEQSRIEKQFQAIRYSIDVGYRNTMAAALRFAADQYRADAAANVGTPSIEGQFTRQAEECELIAERLEP